MQLPTHDRTRSRRTSAELTAPAPEPPVVVIVASASPNVIDAGAVIDNAPWFALLIVTANAADVAELKSLSAAFVAVIEHAPVPRSTCSFPLTIEHAVDAPALKLTAPAPEPPLVVIVASAAPNVADAGAVIDSVAWLALLIVSFCEALVRPVADAVSACVPVPRPVAL